MDKIPVKYVVSTEKQQLCMAEADVPKCTKRRKREPTTTGMCFTDQRQHQLKVDQNAINCTAPKRSSRFRGVSRHRWTGRYEAHLWDKESWNVTRKKKGKQVYLGAYDEEESAARAYDLAALKYWGATTTINFPASDYNEEIAIMQNITKEVYLASLRRKSSGFSRGVSKYRGVARHHHNGRWEARIGRVFGNKYLYLGTYGTQEEAARAYDIAAIEYRGSNAVTNFELSTYIRWLRPESNALVHSQEPQSHAQSQVFSEPSFVNTNNCTVDYLSSPQVFPRELPNMSSNGCSSRTALSLLLRSLLFKELVEKNSNSSEDEIETYNRRCQSPNGSPNTCCDSNSLLSDGTEEEVKSPFLFNGNCYVQLGVSST